MSSICIAGGCLDAQTPTRVRLVKLCEWAESDAEFLKLISVKESSLSSTRPTWHESYAFRQKYLRSYTFSKKEITMADRTKKWLKEKKEKEKKEKVKKDGLVGVVRGVKDRYVSASCFVLGAVFKCLLSCVVGVDVVEH